MLDEATTQAYSGSSKLKYGFELHSAEQNRIYLVVAETDEDRKVYSIVNTICSCFPTSNCFILMQRWMNAIKSNQRRYLARQQVQQALDRPIIV